MQQFSTILISPRNPQEEFSNKAELPKINIGAAIRKKMDEQGTTTAWLAREADCDRSNLSKQLNNNHIYPELLLKISIALKTDFFAYYSDYFQQVIEKQDDEL